MLARRYEAPTVEEALALVRQDLGPDALVLYTRERPAPRWRRWWDPGGVEVIAMPPPASRSDPPVAVRWRSAPPIRIRAGRPRRVAFIGPTGAGKTTTIAKLACEFSLRGWRVHLVAGDTYRVGAPGQLQEYARALDVPVHPASALDGDLSSADLVLIDLPGIHPAMPDRIQAVGAMMERARLHEVHLVISATCAAPVLEGVQEGLAVLRPSRVVLTHLDEVDAGQVRSALRALRLPLSYVAYGPNVPGCIAAARSRAAARWLG
jgi:flagellar biosynthesis protein FlhF